MDINELLRSFVSVNTQREAAATQAANAFSLNTEQVAAGEAATNARGRELVTQAQQVATQKATIDSEEQALRVRSAQLAGFNKDAVEDAYTEALARYNRAETQRQEVRQEFDRLGQIDPLANPVGAIFASIEMQRVGAQNNSLVAERDGAARDIAVRRQMIADYESGAAVDNVAAKKDLALAAASLQAQAGYAELDRQATENLSKQGARALEAYRVRDNVFGIRSDSLTKVMSIQQWQETRALQREQMAAMAEARIERAKKLKEDDEERIEINRRLAAASAVLGLPEPVTLMSIKLLPQDMQKSIGVLASTGTFGTNLNDGLRTITPTISVIAKTNEPLATTAQNIYDALRATEGQIATANRTSQEKVNERDIPDVAEARVAQRWQQSAELANTKLGMLTPVHDLEFNPHKVQASRVLKGVPALANNEYAKLLALSARADGSQKIGVKQEEQAWKLLLDKVSKKELTDDQAAAAVSQYYKAGYDWQYQQSQYGVFGIAPARRYMAVLPDATFFGQPVEANLFDQADVKRAMAKANVGLAAGTSLYTRTQTGTVVPDLLMRGFGQAIETGAEKLSNR